MSVAEDKYVRTEDQAFQYDQKYYLASVKTRWPILMDERAVTEYVKQRNITR